MNKDYDGIEVKRGDIEYERLNRNNLSVDFINRIEKNEKTKLSQKECNHIEIVLNKKTLSNKTPLLNWIVGFAIIGAMIIIPAVFAYKDGVFYVAVIWWLVVAAFISFFVISDRKRKIFEAKKLRALKNNQYCAYLFDVNKKMWCRYSVRAGSVASSDPNSNHLINETTEREDFYIDCGNFLFYVHEKEYMEIKDKLIVLLFFIDGRTALDFFATD